VNWIVVTAKDLAYTYVPPESNQKALWEKLKKDNATDVVFKPDYLRIECDPVSCEQILASGFQELAGTGSRRMDEAGPPPTDDATLRDRFDEA
jgi:hypothetical protein